MTRQLYQALYNVINGRNAVTPEMAKQVIQKHFPAENLVFVLIGKASAIGAAVEKYAEKRDAREIAAPGFWPPEKP